MSTFTQNSIWILRHSNKARKRNTKRKEEVQLSIFEDKTILYLKDSKDSIKNLLALINTFGKVAKYKINIKKSVAFLNANNE
jgi:hypothetical protein